MPRDANKADSKNHIAIEPLRPDLLTAPSTQPHPPIIRSAEHLPLHDPNWKAFEQLMVAILRECHKWRDVREYGVRGQKQHGIDLLGYASDVSQISSDPVVLTCQCKDVKSFTANDLKTAVEIFAQGYRPLASRHIAIAVSCATEDTALIEELNRLRIVHCDLTIDLWGQNQICDMLKNEHEIVRRFFGIHWANAFCTPDAEETKTPPKAHIRQRLTDFASHAKEASLDRLLSRWLAVGLDEETALEFARDGSIGCHPQLLDQVSDRKSVV